MAFGFDDFLGLADVGSDLLGGALSFFGGKSSQRKQIALAREQMSFQERMRDTAHQAEVKDLKAAGLNPMLSVNSGASAPTGALPNVSDYVTPAVNTAMTGKRLNADIEQMKTARENIEADTDKKVADKVATNRGTQLTEQLIKKAEADTIVSKNSAASLATDNLLKTLQLPAARADAAVWDNEYSKYLKAADRIGDTLGKFRGSSASSNRFTPLGSHGAFNPRTGEIIGGR